MKAKRQYAGPASKAFWGRVNKVENAMGLAGSGVYILACSLQDIEQRVLQLLEEYEKQTKKRH